MGLDQHFRLGRVVKPGFTRLSAPHPCRQIIFLHSNSTPGVTLGAFSHSATVRLRFISLVNHRVTLTIVDLLTFSRQNKHFSFPLDSPANVQGTTTGDRYSATLTYDGTSLTLNMYDITAGGACPGANCFTYTWNVNIPSWVGGNTAYVGFTAATGETSIGPLYINSFSYTEGATTQVATRRSILPLERIRGRRALLSPTSPRVQRSTTQPTERHRPRLQASTRAPLQSAQRRRWRRLR